MKKPWRKCAPKANSRPLFNFGNQPKTGTACREFFYKSDIWKENYQKVLKKLTLFFFRTECHPFVTRMSFVYHSFVLVCHSYVLVCHPYVTRMSSVCHSYVLECHPCYSYVLVCHSYVTRLWFCHEPF